MDSTENTGKKASMHWTHILLIVLITVIVTAVGTYWVLKTYIFVSSFKPVTLNEKEEKTLLQKLKLIGYDPEFSSSRMNRNRDIEGEIDEDGFLQPEQYSEEGARRDVSFTEREMNALLAKNTDLAEKLAIDFAEDLVSAKLLLPLEEDFPVLGGKTLRLNAGVGMAYHRDKPVIILKGISIMGIPVPNAWLGGLKNIDLVSEFGVDPGFWKSFADGIEHIQVAEGRIDIRFKE